MTASLVGVLREGFLLALLVVAPLLIAALVAGVITGLIAAFTQIQDPAVSLVPRIAAVAGAVVVFAPAMNNRMWDNPITAENVAKMQKHGYQFIGPAEGWLACRNVGAGRLSESAVIVDEVVKMLAETVSSKPARK